MNNIEKIIGYHFKDENLLNMALTHSSYAHEHNMPCYERLEYLGDALVNFIVGEYLYSNFDLPAGQLTKYRACLVSTESFAKIIENLGLEQYILIGKSVQKISKSLLADIFESLLASIYLDGGKENADKLLEYMAMNGYRHHVAITKGHWGKAVEIAFRDYLGYQIDLI